MPGRCAAERNLRIGPISAYSSAYFLGTGFVGNLPARVPGSREVTENQTSQAVPDGNTTVRDGELPEPV